MTTSVCTEGEAKCPVCGSMNTAFDLNCDTNEQELDCHNPECGFSAHTRIVERWGRKFWEVFQQFPMDDYGVVRRPPGSIVDYGRDEERRLADGALPESIIEPAPDLEP